MTNNQHRNKHKLDIIQFMLTLAITLFPFPIDEESEKLESIKLEIKDSDRQKQEVLGYCQVTISLTNIINSKTPI